MTRRSDVTLPTPDGECPAALVVPDGEGPWPGVILFMDAGGLRPSMVEMAERMAAMGYVVLVPELYYRFGTYRPFDFASVFGDSDERARLFEMLKSLSNEMVISDTGAFLDYLTALPEVADTKVGTTGYCMGGRISLVVAPQHADRIGATASFHGGGIGADGPDSPVHTVGGIAGRVYVAGADNDNSYPPEQADRLEAALTEAGVEHTLEIYDGKGHGFRRSGRAGVRRRGGRAPRPSARRALRNVGLRPVTPW